jgi:hypothetical protein
MLPGRAALVVVVAAAAAACTGSPSSPGDVVTTQIVEGQAVNALDGAGAPGLSVRVGSNQAVTTDATGYFRTEISSPGQFATLIAGDAIVERRTLIAGPTTTRARVSFIPATFDLYAFDEMFRTANARLQRWTTQPSLVVVASVMSYKGAADEFTATSEQMSDEEVSSMVAHMTEGLALLTGGTFSRFADIAVERPAAGERTLVRRRGAIVVGRYNGILTFAQTIGYGTWAEEPDGTVVGGAMFLDRAFDRDNERRRLLRIHELGHALGYLHVTTRTSIMNPAIGPEPTAFDAAAAVIAFQRPPGNVTPDTDPGSSGSSSPGWNIRWASPVSCRLEE